MRLAKGVLLICLLAFGVRAKKKSWWGLVPVTRIERIQECPEYNNEDAKLTWVDIKDLGKGVTQISADLRVGKYPPPKLNAVATLNRCKTIDDTNCEHFIKAQVDFCQLLTKTDQFYSEALDFKPILRCPFVSGSMHYVRNATLDAKKMLTYVGFMPPEYFHTHFRIKLMVQDAKPPNTNQMCITITFKIQFVKP